MYSALHTWALSRAVVVGSAWISSKCVKHHDFSDALLGETGWFSFLLRWDAVLFCRIAKEGYSSDSSTAFFPLLPLTTKYLSDLLGVSISTSGFILSNLSFLIAAVFLYRITEKYLGSQMAKRSCFLFCFSPCSILYSSLYSEALFSMFALMGVWYTLKKKRILSTVCLSLGAATRSNGFLLAPLLVIDSVKEKNYFSSLLALCPIGTFLSIQMYWWKKRFYDQWVLPYSYVQSRYWEQGFLRFYTYPKNIPNFFVGIPFVFLSLFVTLKFLIREKNELFIRLRTQMWKGYFTPFKTVSFFLHSLLLFQSFLSLFFIHMNMHFRFVSFNSVIFWELSSFLFREGLMENALLFGYLAFGVAYALLYGAYFPPA